MTRDEYWETVHRIAKELAAGETTLEDDIYSETVQDADCLSILEYTKNRDALFDSQGDVALAGTTSVSEVLRRLAGAALEADVNDNPAPEPDESDMPDELAALLSHVTCTYDGKPNTSTDLETLQSLVQWDQGSLPSDHGIVFEPTSLEHQARRVLREYASEIESLLEGAS